MAGLFSRLKIWAAGETVNNTDLNNEFNNILSNVDAEHSEGYSQNLPQMQSTEDPGGVGSEDLTQPISTAQEIKRLRYAINRIIGGAQWYSTPTLSLDALTQTVVSLNTLPRNRIVSGRVSSFNQPDFLRANTTDVKLLCTATPFVCVIDDVEYTFNTDITLAGLSAGYTANHTALNADLFTGGEDSRVAGESVSLYMFDRDHSYIDIGTVGSQISNRVGQLAALKIVNGASVADYFLCRIASATKLENLFRGFFRDTAGLPTPIANLVTGETITILRLTYILLNTSGNLLAIYNEPSYQADQPTSFSSGDYWFDTVNETWKTYNGSGWVAANVILVGICAQDSTGCVVSRSGDFFRSFSNTNEIGLGDPPATGSAYYSKRFGGKISVYGKDFTRINDWVWDLATDVDTGLTAAAGVWYFYVTDTGDTVLSTVHPNDRFGSLSGFYHPAKPWRCIGFANAASASTWDAAQPFASFSSISLQSIPDESVNIRSIQPRTVETAYFPTMPLGGLALSQSISGAGAEQTTASLTPVDLTNQSVTITVTGKRPVWVGFIPDAANATPQDYFSANLTSGSGAISAFVNFVRGVTVVGKKMFGSPLVATTTKVIEPATAFYQIDFPPAGTYTYKAQMYAGAANHNVAASANLRLAAYEIL